MSLGAEDPCMCPRVIPRQGVNLTFPACVCVPTARRLMPPGDGGVSVLERICASLASPPLIPQLLLRTGRDGPSSHALDRQLRYTRLAGRGAY